MKTRPMDIGGSEAKTMPHRIAALEDLHAQLRAAGQRLTPQRLLILELLFAHGEHASAEELFSEAQSRYPYLNISTVYRTLDVLRDIGLVSETDLGDGVRRFSLLAENRHHHLVCLDCGFVESVDDTLFDDLREVLRATKHFEARIDHLAIFGTCSACTPQ